MSIEIPEKKNLMEGFKLDLPVDLIQHIQSFLNGKESAQTCVLSKSWFTAWSTYPILRLCEQDFPVTGDDTVSTNFSNFARNRIQRYNRLNTLILRIERFSSLENCTPLVNEIINRALLLGLKSLSLTVIPKPYVLLGQVFATESLTGLCVDWCDINELIDVRCSRLTHLALTFVYASDDIVRRVLLGCPLIEKLKLSHCEGLESVLVGKMKKLVKLVVGYDDEGSVEFKDVGVPQFLYLRKLNLFRVKLNKDFFSEFASMFPCIKDLCLAMGYGSCEDVKLSSGSLSSLSLYNGEFLKKMQFDVPNVKFFCFMAILGVPLLSFGDVKSRDWVSDIRLECGQKVVEDSLFLEMKKFLTKLRGFRIDLNIHIIGEFTTSFERIPCFPIPVVEILEVVDVLNASSSLLRGIFWCCRPSFISFSAYEYLKNPFLKLLYELVIQDNNSDLLRMYNLKEVNFELFEDNAKEWLAIPWERLVDDLKYPRGVKGLRLRLNWE